MGVIMPSFEKVDIGVFPKNRFFCINVKNSDLATFSFVTLLS